MAVVLEKLNLIRFGKFQNYEFDAKNGLNIVYGVNEAGKSTINLFIKAMLYGMPTRKRAGEVLKERERAVPWNEKKAEGILTVNNNGVCIEIRRQFGKTSAGDKTEVCYAASGEKLGNLKINTIGEWLFGVPCEVFEKTFWISQNGAFMGGRDDKLISRVSNLAESGDEVVSAKRALEKLAALKKKIKAADRRNADGRLDELNKRLDECRREKYDLSTRLAQQKSSKERKTKLEAELSETESSINELEIEYKKSLNYEKKVSEREVYRQICECDKKLNKIYQDEIYKKSRNLSNETVSDAFITKEKIETLERELANNCFSEKDADYDKSKLKYGVIVGVGAAMLIIGLIMAAVFSITLKFVGATVLMLFVALAGAACGTFGIRNIIKCNVLKDKFLNEKAEAEQRIKKITDEVTALKNNLNCTFGKFDVKDTDELRNLFVAGQSFDARVSGIIDMKNNLLRGYNTDLSAEASEIIEDDNWESSEKLDAELNRLRKKHIGIVTELKEIESKMAYNIREYRIPADIDTEINYIKDEICKCNDEIYAINLAEDIISRVAEKWNSMIAPEINRVAGSIMDKLTTGGRNDIRISDEFMIRVVSGNNLSDAEYYSRGTYEQLYFALRLALAKNIDGGNPLFLDDILTTYDDNRAEAAVRLLNDFTDDGQIFLFTCHGHIEKMAEAAGAHIIRI